MENEYRVYNKSGKFIASYGLGWSLLDIFNSKRDTVCGKINAALLQDKCKAESVVLVVDGREVNRMTRDELKQIR